EDFGSRRLLERPVRHVAYDADDGPPSPVAIRPAKFQALADRIRTAPEPPRERLVDDRDRRCPRPIVRCEVAATPECNPERAEVLRSHTSQACSGGVAVGGPRLPLHRTAVNQALAC